MSEHSPEPTSPAGSSWGQSQGHIPSPNVQATMTQMTSQLQTVIDAAERAAEAIRFDAEEQARHHLAEAQRKADRLTAERVGLIRLGALAAVALAARDGHRRLDRRPARAPR